MTSLTLGHFEVSCFIYSFLIIIHTSFSLAGCKTSPPLYLSCVGEGCKATMKTQKCFADEETSPDCINTVVSRRCIKCFWVISCVVVKHSGPTPRQMSQCLCEHADDLEV